MATSKKTTKTVKKKAPVKKAPVKKAPAKKATKKPSTGTGKIKVTKEQLYKMTCEAAYYVSLEQTQETNNPDKDWVQAETAINKIYTAS